VKDTDSDGYADNVDPAPTGVENIAPTITYFGYSENVIVGYFEIRVQLKAMDQGSSDKIQSIKVTVASPFRSDTETVDGGDFDKKLHIEWFSGGQVSGFDITAEITDLNGNVRKVTNHLQGFLEWVVGGGEEFLHTQLDPDHHYELTGFPRAWQGPFGLCAAYTCLEIAHWYFVPDTLVEVTLKSGDADVINGMTGDQQTAYYKAIGVWEANDYDPTFEEIKKQIRKRVSAVYGWSMLERVKDIGDTTAFCAATCGST
jgi:hypothetical protein